MTTPPITITDLVNAWVRPQIRHHRIVNVFCCSSIENSGYSELVRFQVEFRQRGETCDLCGAPMKKTRQECKNDHLPHNAYRLVHFGNGISFEEAAQTALSALGA